MAGRKRNQTAAEWAEKYLAAPAAIDGLTLQEWRKPRDVDVAAVLGSLTPPLTVFDRRPGPS